MRTAINLIPDPPPPSESPFFSMRPRPSLYAGAYRAPAIFEASTFSQIYVDVIAASGLQLDSDTLKTHLWPQAKQVALMLYEKYRIDESGSSARANSVTTWLGPPFKQLGF